MYFMNDIFTKTYLNIITELIEAGKQFNSDFPKLNDLKFYKIRFSTHAAKNDAERDVTKGNSKWLYNLIDNTIYKVISSHKYDHYFKTHDNIITFSIFTNYYDLTQVSVEVNLNTKTITLITLISGITKERFNRLTSLNHFEDDYGRFNIPIKV